MDKLIELRARLELVQDYLGKMSTDTFNIEMLKEINKMIDNLDIKIKHYGLGN